jgi:hypothetical protein
MIMKLKDSFTKIRAIFNRNYDTATTAVENHPLLEDAKGRLCPLHTIKPVDLARHDLITDRLDAAKILLGLLQEFKEQTFADISAFVDVSAAEYEVKMGGVKGNLMLVNHNETRKIKIAIQDRITFDERLQVAKQLFDELINEHSDGLDDVIATLISQVFSVDKAGKVDTRKVLELRRYNIKHPKWLLAMEAINDSIKVSGSKSYIQMYERDTPEDEWKGVFLDLAKV